MGLRFRRSVRIAKGVRLNISTKSVGISAGTRGARISTNSRTGTRVTVGVPGTGLSHSQKVGGGKKRRTASRKTSVAPPNPPVIQPQYSLPSSATFNFLGFGGMVVGFFMLRGGHWFLGVLVIVVGWASGFCAYRSEFARLNPDAKKPNATPHSTPAPLRSGDSDTTDDARIALGRNKTTNDKGQGDMSGQVFCTQCGLGNASNANFCGGCGTRLTLSQTAPPIPSPQVGRGLADTQDLSRLKQKMVTTRDEVEDITWFRHAGTPRLDFNSLGVYFGKFDYGVGPLRLDFHYHGDDGLFVESFVVRADNQKFSFEVDYGRVNRDFNEAGAFEAYDTVVTPEMQSMLDAVVRANNVTLRFYGDSYADFQIDSKARGRIQEVMELRSKWKAILSDEEVWVTPTTTSPLGDVGNLDVATALVANDPKRAHEIAADYLAHNVDLTGQAHIALGHALLNLDRIEESEIAFLQASKVAKKELSVEAVFMRAKCAYHLGESRRALDILDHLFINALSTAWRSKVHLLKGECFLFLGDEASGDKELRQAAVFAACKPGS
jgi:hypothetical protein